jgi:hypothetical protein
VSSIVELIFAPTDFEGCAYLISRYYKRRDFSIRYAVFFSAAVLAGAFGGVCSILRFDP